MHEPPDALAQRWCSKIQQQTDPAVRQLKICSKLPQVNPGQCLGCLDLDQHDPVDDHVCAIRAFHVHLVILQRNGFLKFEPPSPCVELVGETPDVGGFEEAGPEFPVD